MLWMHKRCKYITKSSFSKEHPYSESAIRGAGLFFNDSKCYYRYKESSQIDDERFFSRMVWNSSDTFVLDGLDVLFDEDL